MHWNLLTNIEKHHLWLKKDPRVPADYIPSSLKPWSELTIPTRARLIRKLATRGIEDYRIPPECVGALDLPLEDRPWDLLPDSVRRKLHKKNDPRVPLGYKPTDDKRGAYRKYRMVYTQPASIVIPLTPALLELPDDTLWDLLETQWDDLGISPKVIHFRVKETTVLTVKNPRLKKGALSRPVLA